MFLQYKNLLTDVSTSCSQHFSLHHHFQTLCFSWTLSRDQTGESLKGQGLGCKGDEEAVPSPGCGWSAPFGLLCEALHCYVARWLLSTDDPCVYIFFDLFQQFTVVGTVHKASLEMKLWWLGLAYTVDSLLWISTALHPSATKNLIIDCSSITEQCFLSDIFVYYQNS